MKFGQINYAFKLELLSSLWVTILSNSLEWQKDRLFENGT